MTEKPLDHEEAAKISARIDELSDAIGLHMTALEKSPSKEERLEIWAAVRCDMDEWRDLSDRLAGWVNHGTVRRR